MKHKQIIKLLKKTREKCISAHRNYGNEDCCEHCGIENLCNTLFIDAPIDIDEKTLATVKEEIKKL